MYVLRAFLILSETHTVYYIFRWFNQNRREPLIKLYTFVAIFVCHWTARVNKKKKRACVCTFYTCRPVGTSILRGGSKPSCKRLLKKKRLFLISFSRIKCNNIFNSRFGLSLIYILFSSNTSENRRVPWKMISGQHLCV